MSSPITSGVLKKILTGAGYGAGGLLGVLALRDIISRISQNILPMPEEPDKINLNIIEKKSTISPFTEMVPYGIGIPIGVYGAYKIYNYLDRANKKLEYISKLEEYKKLLEKKYGKITKKSALDDTYNKLPDDYKDRLIDAYCEGFSKAYNDDFIKQSDELTLFHLFPLALGATVPIGFLAGYYGAQALNPIPGDEEEEEYKIPSFNVNVKKAELEKIALGWEDIEKVISGGKAFFSNLLSGSAKGLKFGWDVISFPFRTIDIKHDIVPAAVGLSAIGGLYALLKAKKIYDYAQERKKMWK